MSQQIQLTGGAKVRNLQDVIIGTSGVLSSLAFDVANGVPKLDSNGKILVSQLPNSVMEYKGTWNAATNTPTLVNGTGNQGDVYLCNVAGTVDFGAGPIAFVVGDQVIYSGSIWQRASGATGTVTSVAITESGDSLNITGSPITTSGTINIGFNGTNLQYVNGAGNLTTFPTLTGYVPYSGATANVNLGEYGLSGGFIGFDTTPTSTPTAQGTMYWNADKESVDVIMNGVTGSVMQDTFYNVKNQTGATITKGTIVRANGTVGASGRILIAPFLADGSYDSKVCLGVTAETILNGEDGKVTAFGAIRQIDTSAFANGTILYASPTTAGGFTSTEPTNPNNIVTIAIVVYSDVNNGEIFVRPTFVDNAADIAAALGYTPANDALVVHLAGTETITGSKTFTALTTFTSTSATGLDYGAYITKGLTPSVFSSGTTNIYSEATSNNVIFRDNVSKAKLVFNNSTQTFTFPAATGTLALTSDLSGYLPLTGGTLTGPLNGTTAAFSDSGTSANTNLISLLQPNLTVSYGPILTLGKAISINNAASIQFNYTSAGSNSNSLTLALYGSSGLQIYGNGNAVFAGTLTIGSTLSNGTYTYTLPSASGTLALTSALTGGTVTSVAMTVPTGLSVSGSPITTSGTLAVSLASGYSIPTTASQTNWDIAYTNRITSATSPLSIISNVIAMSEASGSVDGYLSRFDWTTFYNKQATITLTTTGTSGAATFTSNTLNIPNYGSALSGYLPLTGGTLTGALGVNGDLEAIKLKAGTSTGYSYLRFYNSANAARAYLGLFNSAGVDYVVLDGSGYKLELSGSPIVLNNNSYNVLIGTTTDSGYKLDVNGTGRFSNELRIDGAGIKLFVNGSNSLGGFFYQQSITGTTYANNMQMGASGDNQFWNYTTGGGWVKQLSIATTGAATFSSTLRANSEITSYNGSNYGYWGVDAGNSYVYFGTSSSGYALSFQTAGTQRLGIASTGAATFSSLAGVGSRTVNASATGELSAASDSRLKQEDLNHKIEGLAEILKIQPRAYKWLYDIDNRGENATTEIGFFANEIASIIPSAAPMGNDGYYGFYDRAVIAALVKGMQEQQKQIEELKKLIK